MPCSGTDQWRTVFVPAMQVMKELQATLSQSGCKEKPATSLTSVVRGSGNLIISELVVGLTLVRYKIEVKIRGLANAIN